MRRIVAISVLAILSVPCLSFANPDGPVGSIVLQPAFHMGRAANQWRYDFQAGDFTFTEEQTWEARMGFLVPVWNYLTLGLEVSRIKGTSALSQVRLAQAPSDLSTGLNHVEMATEWTLSGRIYLPLTPGARRELGQSQRP